MSRPITCTLCGTMVDDADCVDMPNGPMCLDPCYIWLENMMDDSEEFEGEDGEEITIYFDGDWEDIDDLRSI